MTITTPRGFRASGIRAGIKSSGSDLALVVNDGPLDVAASVYTSNKAKANPILWSQEAAKKDSTRAIILNSGDANCFSGDFGYETTKLTAELTAQELGIEPHQVQVCSTGIIGEGGEEFRDKILAHIPTAVNKLSLAGGTRAAAAILTTDTHPKTSRFRGEGWEIAGMAKGAGMLAPGLATMLVVLTTDAEISSEVANDSLRDVVGKTFNRLDSDGCMSTNDQITLLVSGASGVQVPKPEFETALYEVCMDLTLQLLGDAEGSAHDIEIVVENAASEEDALAVGRAISRSNLFKTAIFGNDPNWGRILAAAGTADAQFDPYQTDVTINGVRVCSNGGPDRPRDEVDLADRDVQVVVDLKAGDADATLWTSDLTHDYVHENSAYST